MNEVDRIREEYQRRDRTIPADFYAWHREEIQYWQAGVARACARLLHRSGAFPIDAASIADIGCGSGQWLLEHPGAEVTIDLPTATLQLPTGLTVTFPIEAFARYCLTQGVDELGFLLAQQAKIEAFERRGRS